MAASDTLNQAWSKDKSNFGFRMLQKMGWAEGKGLGANEDGTATHVRVKRRRENLALGAEAVSDMTGNATLTGAVDDFNSILASLKPVGAAGVTADAKSGLSSAAAARFHKVLRNKDVSRYSATDMSAILGHAPAPRPAARDDAPAPVAAARAGRGGVNAIVAPTQVDGSDSDVGAAAAADAGSGDSGPAAAAAARGGAAKETRGTKEERRARREARRAARRAQEDGDAE